MTVTDERKRTVRAAYDALGARFGEWGEQTEGDPWEPTLVEGDFAELDFPAESFDAVT